ncbi:MAG TPA: MDR family MFS transporter [Candidatus Acidoferrales bacterium]|nr:MDR family MFS transporter [Candidatus Acidoferrales bacterium]
MGEVFSLVLGAGTVPGKRNWKPKHNPWLIAVSVMIATFMEVMDTSIASVAVPYIAGSTASTYNEAEWVLTVYLLANAVFLPASTWFAERFGRKRFLMISIIVFTIASFGCGIAPTLPLILLARCVQGAGGGALQPLSQAILVESFPPEKQGQAMGLYALGVVLAPVIGPAFGGYLTDAISWRWAFYINVPVGLLALLLQSKFLEDPPYITNAKPGKLDGVGLGLLGLWVACMQFILDKGQEDDWFGNTNIRWAFVIMLITFTVFMFREFRTKKPLVDLRALANRNLALGCLGIFVLGMGIYSLTTVLPVFYQTLMRYDATDAGLAVSPRGLGSIVASIVVGVIISKLDPRKIVAAGFGILAFSTYRMGLLTLQISPTTLFWPIVFSGMGMTMVFVPLSNVALGTVPKSEVGNASGIFNFLRNIGGSVGISAANTIAQRHLQTHRNENVHWLSGANWILQGVLRHLTTLMRMHAGPHQSMLRALSLIQTTLNSQAQLWAYVDDFRYIALLCALCIPLGFFLKKPSAEVKAAG